MDKETLALFLTTPTKPFPFPYEAVVVFGHFRIRRLVERDGFETLESWYDWYTQEHRRPYLYFAAPLFSEAEKRFNAWLVRRLERYVDVYLPQRDGDLLVELLKKMPLEQAKARIFRNDILAIRRSDGVIAVLDGRFVDEGEAVEVGYATALGKPCWALDTDPRRQGIGGCDHKLRAVMSETFTSSNALVKWVRKYANSLALA